jgi:hypothetical protein
VHHQRVRQQLGDEVPAVVHGVNHSGLGPLAGLGEAMLSGPVRALAASSGTRANEGAGPASAAEDSTSAEAAVRALAATVTLVLGDDANRHLARRADGGPTSAATSTCAREGGEEESLSPEVLAAQLHRLASKGGSRRRRRGGEGGAGPNDNGGYGYADDDEEVGGRGRRGRGRGRRRRTTEAAAAAGRRRQRCTPEGGAHAGVAPRHRAARGGRRGGGARGGGDARQTITPRRGGERGGGHPAALPRTSKKTNGREAGDEESGDASVPNVYRAWRGASERGAGSSSPYDAARCRHAVMRRRAEECDGKEGGG